MCLNIDLEGQNGEKYSEALYMTSGEDKGCKNYYEDKEKNKRFLPGFIHANALALLTAGKEIGLLDSEKKIIEIYNPETKKKEPQEVPMVMELLGQPIRVGILRVRKNKNTKSGEKYVATNDEQISNEIDKFFRAEDGLTVPELAAGETEAKFLDEWKKRWDGKTKDQFKEVKGGAAAAKSGAPTSKPAGTPKLFGKA
jgi:hypothetical protein